MKGSPSIAALLLAVATACGGARPAPVPPAPPTIADAAPPPETVPVVLAPADEPPVVPDDEGDLPDEPEPVPAPPIAPPPVPPPVEGTDEFAAVPGAVQHGKSTWYGGRHHGGPTASGERFDKRALTAAHRTLPMGTMVRVTHDKSGRSVVVRINDRGPFGRDRSRCIDVSEAAARVLGIMDAGVATVTLEVVSVPPAKPKRR